MSLSEKMRALKYTELTMLSEYLPRLVVALEELERAVSLYGVKAHSLETLEPLLLEQLPKARALLAEIDKRMEG